MNETILYTQHLYEGHIVNLDLHEVRLSDGNQRKREVIRHPGATAVVALDADGNVLLVRQFRIAAGKVLRELPAGTLKPDEPARDCAIRELQEETGYKPGTLTDLGGFYAAPGYTTEYIHLFLATDLKESRLDGDADEFIELDRLTLAEALAMVHNGDIADGKTIIGLMLAAARLNAK